MEKLANFMIDPLFSQKLSVLSPLSFSHTLQRINGENEAHGVKLWVYIHVGRCRVTQESLVKSN